MLSNTFLFHVGLKYFPGCNVTIPFFLTVEYAYYPSGIFAEVLNVEISFKAVGCLHLNNDMAIEIEQAARQHLIQTFVPSPVEPINISQEHKDMIAFLHNQLKEANDYIYSQLGIREENNKPQQ